MGCREPNLREITNAIAYIQNQFRLRNGLIEWDMWIEALSADEFLGNGADYRYHLPAGEDAMRQLKAQPGLLERLARDADIYRARNFMGKNAEPRFCSRSDLRGANSALPRWTKRRGWVGGDSKTLYKFTDKLTGQWIVRPGGGPNRAVPSQPGDNATVKVATCAEAKTWQDPLHSGWSNCK